ncbi:hypothetical protein BX600DRAFT_89674 [Xylariales sp. PMI_506]|nr:hypothetical protein BX600DRAFT_89674 [Xylariales sp. PMI_506]
MALSGTWSGSGVWIRRMVFFFLEALLGAFSMIPFFRFALCSESSKSLFLKIPLIIGARCRNSVTLRMHPVVHTYIHGNPDMMWKVDAMVVAQVV